MLRRDRWPPPRARFEAFFEELTSGDPTTVLTALIDGPANIANAFLNGSIGLDVLGVNLPLLNGVLVPDTSLNIPVDVNVQTLLTDLLGATEANLIISTLAGVGITVPTDLDVASISVGPFSGLIDALVNVIPQQILTDPPGAGTDLTSLLDPSTLLSGLDLGNLGGLLDPSTLLGDLTALLPSAAADLPAGLADLATLIPF